MYLVALLVLLFLLLTFSTTVEEIRIRRLLRAKRKAEKSAARKANLLAILSHEIRNPLTGVLSITRLLGNTALDETQRELLRTIDNSGHELLSLLDDTLEQSRIESDQFSITSESFILHDIIRPLLTAFDCQAREKGIMLTMHIHPTIPAMLCGDAGRIRQVLFNLLANAIKFTPAGIIKIRIDKHIQIKHRSLPDDPIAICFQVIDSGIGIPPDVLPQIFEPYKQGGDIQQRFGGTGLGLSTSRMLARAMGGDIVVESKEAHGSIFSMTLPLKTVPATCLESDNSIVRNQAPELPSLKLLVVDDSDIHRIATRAMLETAGHQVCVATTATEAFALLQWQRFDCVFLDLHLPDIDAITAINKIRDTALNGKPVPDIIVVSAWLDPADIDQLLAAGANAACTKPLDELTLHHLMAAIRIKLPTREQNISPLLPHRRTTRIS